MKITKPTHIEHCFQAVKDRDRKSIGSFFFGVKTTGIFCIPSCRARTPKPENIVYFTEAQDLIDEGFRACKLCKPTENADETPEEVKTVLQLIQESPDKKIKDSDLLELNIRPEKLRRWFKKHYGVTFQAYQRMARINAGVKELESGKDMLDSALSAGYESLSGFQYSLKNLLGNRTGKANNNSIIHIQRTTTPLGPILLGASKKGICFAQFIDHQQITVLLKEIQEQKHAQVLLSENEILKKAINEIKLYFQGEQLQFTTPLDFKRNDKEEEMLKILNALSPGQNIPDKELCTQLKCSEKELSNILKQCPDLFIPKHRITFTSKCPVEENAKRNEFLIRHEQINLK